MLRKNAKVELIKRVPLFAHCSGKELAQIASVADEMDFPAGKVLTKEGSRGHEFFVLVEGTADVRRTGRKINTMRAGDFFGEIAILSGRTRTATVTAATPVRALVLTEATFRELLRKTPSLPYKILQALVARLPAD
jgi:CRP/FNR family cyclic AMP-dependent transcriptional regulator